MTATTAGFGRPDLKRWLVPASFVAGVVAAAGLGSIATSGTVDSAWFDALEKPSWYPPGATFGIVWTVLYVMIAAAGIWAWRAGAPQRATVAWWAQIGLNLVWSVVFFGLRRPGWALAEIVVLVVAVALTAAWSPRGPRLLLLPYLAWVLFATALTTSIVVLN